MVLWTDVKIMLNAFLWVYGRERRKELKMNISYVTLKNLLPWRMQRPVIGDRAKPGRHTQLTPVIFDSLIQTARLSHLAQLGSSLMVITERKKNSILNSHLQ